MINGTYDEVYGRWRDAPESFWAELAEAVHWYKKWDKILDASRPPFYRWFTGGMVNTCYNALDRHVDKAGETSQLSFTTAPSLELLRLSAIASCWMR